MRTPILLLLFLVVLSACQFSKSVQKDLASGLLTTGDGLSCENVYLSVNDETIYRNTFIYGEEFAVNFNNIEGFTKDNDYVFPGMKLFVVSSTGDTALQAEDLYSKYINGLKLSPLLLTSEVTVASPLKSNGDYTLYNNIWDKKGRGKFSAKFNFKIISNEKILIEAVNIRYNEIYFYSKERETVITDNKMKFNENTYVIFEGLSGFKEDNGTVFPGLSLKATDNEGSMIIGYSDLFADYTRSGLPVSDVNRRISSNFILSGSEFKNPLHCEVMIWDKKSDARIKATADLVVE